MLILTIRTDKPEAEIGLYNDAAQIDYMDWLAHRQLAETIHLKVDELLTAHGLRLIDVKGIVCFKGPGSFTGLRIGLTVANALAESLVVPCVASQDPGWIETGVKKLLRGENDRPALPEYGAPVHITPQKK
ncbi:hypothetical protein JNM87_05000 [Candidatus Saccharibacteria bacterium]|nr:hypothetical protein [Candidatus Saccharibacteria bacterium]